MKIASEMFALLRQGEGTAGNGADGKCGLTLLCTPPSLSVICLGLEMMCVLCVCFFCIFEVRIEFSFSEGIRCEHACGVLLSPPPALRCCLKLLLLAAICH